MATTKRKTLDGWIRDAIADKDKDHPLSMISLVHMVGSQQKEIHSTKFAGGKSWDPIDLAQMFRGKAESFSQDLPGVQTFQLLGFYGTKEAQAFQPFTCTPAPETSGLTTEAPTSEGRVQQLMRQGEALFQQTYRRQQALDEQAIRIIELQGNMLTKVMAENRDSFMVVKDMLMEKAMDNHKHVMSQLEYQRSSDERKKWIAYIPVLVNTVMGREIFPVSTADTTLFEGIVESIDEQQIGMLATIVKPEMMGPLMHRFTQIKARKNQEEENKRKALQPKAGINPLLDAGGLTQDSEES